MICILKLGRSPTIPFLDVCWQLAIILIAASIIDGGGG